MLPANWRIVCLGDHVGITSGESPSGFRFKDSGIPYFKVEQLSSRTKYLDGYATPYHFTDGKVVPKDSVIFAKRGAAIALNKVRMLSQSSFMDTNLMALTPKEGLLAEYLYYGLGYLGLWRFADTTSVPQINNKHVKPLLFPLPPPAEQEAIAEALGDADAYIESLEQLLAKKRAVMQGAMQELLAGKRRLPGFSGEWRLRPLHDLAMLKSGESITSAKINESARYPCYGGNGLRGYTDRFTHEGDFALIGRQGALCGNVVSVEGRFFASEHAVVVRANEGIDVRWLAFVLRHANLNRYSESSAQPGLSVGKILLLEFAVPPTRDEQAAIATVLHDMASEMSALETKLDKARAIKQGMMQELLTGRMRLV